MAVSISSYRHHTKAARVSFVVPVAAQILLNFANDFLRLIIRNSAHPSNYKFIISKSLLCFPGRTFSSRHHCEKLYGCAAAAAVIISLLDLELAKKNREIKTIGKIDTRPQSTKMAARAGVYHLS